MAQPCPGQGRQAARPRGHDQDAVAGAADVATMAESGYPEIKGESWFAVVVPAGTPKDIIALLNREIVKSIALPDMKEHLATLGYEPLANTPDECAAQFRADMVQWGKVIRAAGIKTE